MLPSRFIFIPFLAFAGLVSFADDAPTLQQMPSQFVMDYVSVTMPGGQPNMGLLGVHYDLNLLPIKDFYTGLGSYGAVAGNQGGFFTLGLDNNYRPHLYGPWYLNSGFYVGGGGARAAQTGGGLMLMPYGGLGLHLGKFIFTLNYSYVTFPTGSTASSQFLFGVTMPLDFNYFPANESHYQGLPFASLHLPGPAIIHNLYVSPMVQDYQVSSGTLNQFDQVVDNNLGLVGFEAGKYFTQNIFGALRTMAVANGNANGYMNVLAGPGYTLPLGASPFSWVTEVMAGAGGGGNLQTHGGFLAEADTGFTWNITSAFSPRLMFGYLTAPNGNFNTWVYSLGLNYNFGILSSNSHGSHLNDDLFSLKDWRVSINNQTLFDPQRTTSDYSGNINSIEAHLDQFLTPSYYLSYRAAFAYQGDHAGGMAEGMIGLGWQHPLAPLPALVPHLALLGGAIGGGNINAGGGFIVEPEVGISYLLTPAFALNVSGGRMISVQNNLNSNVLTAGIEFNFGEAQKF